MNAVVIGELPADPEDEDCELLLQPANVPTATSAIHITTSLGRVRRRGNNPTIKIETNESAAVSMRRGRAALARISFAVVVVTVIEAVVG